MAEQWSKNMNHSIGWFCWFLILSGRPAFLPSFQRNILLLMIPTVWFLIASRRFRSRSTTRSSPQYKASAWRERASYLWQQGARRGETAGKPQGVGVVMERWRSLSRGGEDPATKPCPPQPTPVVVYRLHREGRAITGAPRVQPTHFRVGEASTRPILDTLLPDQCG